MDLLIKYIVTISNANHTMIDKLYVQ